MPGRGVDASGFPAGVAGVGSREWAGLLPAVALEKAGFWVA